MLAVELERLGRGAEAEQALEKALQRWPEHARLNAVAAQILELRQGQVDKAIARARAAVTRDPELVLGWRVLGQAYEAASKRREAEDAYRKGLEARPDEADLHARLGMLLARNGVAEGELHLREAIRTAREFQPEVHVALAAWLADSGRFAEAWSWMKRCWPKPRRPVGPQQPRSRSVSKRKAS
jgi:tetratricopeptide (TPR) repeat protein